MTKQIGNKIDNRHNQRNKRNTGNIVTTAFVVGGLAVLGANAIRQGDNVDSLKPNEGGPNVEFTVGKTLDNNGNVITTAWQIAETAIGKDEDIDPRAVVEVVREQLPQKDQKNIILHTGQVVTLGPDAQGGTRVEPAPASVDQG
ncbi:hypothetical protein A3A68_00980 [Candidatus Saccharibacteria bacterium RIFCSPLOWO2_01_FULL_48_13]|nr:MAG: hypothetical protein A2884_01920 [Candidatus Saccharibacteria bacterium RIFCSPHIGHO2_01_FULL_48_12]OGL36159.1 MAG: hypothetical protein A3F38_01250 [Candidatus Saccharibacteria bacterium RIFCSPHIGHO2_12_FULL_48_21]OGL36801.1 MAG: hypothetical protein A3A68_00980 [Candidatus Saccharibacteria bacterium RIFCSPLOWO2_01_FULL_48_13]